MIQAELSCRALSVGGHAENDRRVCHAVSAILETLHAAYGAPPPESGFFHWEFRITEDQREHVGVLQFVRAYLRLLQEQYPRDFNLIDLTTEEVS